MLKVEDLEELKFIDSFLLKELFHDLDFIIAGGCFTQLFLGNKPNDIDVFFKNENQMNIAVSRIKNNSNFKITFENDYVLNSFKNNQKIQLIKKYFFENPEDILQSFDFTIVKFAYNGEEIFYHDRFFKDLAKKRLVIDKNLMKPLGTLKRSYKYTKRGFTLCPKAMARLAKNIQELNIDWENPDDNQIEFYSDGTPTFLGID